jgi:predicted ester cyclase
MSVQESANQFFDACETGKGWDVCSSWCLPNASFSAQAGALAEVTTLAAYCDWMKGLLVPIPDGHYELKSMAIDNDRQIALAYAVFHGTHTVEGPVPPTGKTVAADYVYSMEFQDGKIRHMTKIWNDAHSLKQLGWA